jgi:hypothetical protein
MTRWALIPGITVLDAFISRPDWTRAEIDHTDKRAAGATKQDDRQEAAILGAAGAGGIHANNGHPAVGMQSHSANLQGRNEAACFSGFVLRLSQQFGSVDAGGAHSHAPTLCSANSR